MEDRLLTVKEFAEAAGVSVQSVYKKMIKKDHPIQRFVNHVDGVKYIRNSALDLLYQKPQQETAKKSVFEPTEKQSEQQTTHGTDRLLDILEAQLSEQRNQLQEKDRIILAQADHIASLLARLEDLTRAVDQQQQLTAISVKALAISSSPESVADPGGAQPLETATKDATRGGVLKRIFKRK